jgi:hypothetical protein
MRPESLRRYGIAAVAGGLLLASGTVPGLASDVDTTEGTRPGRVTSGADREGTAVSWLAEIVQSLDRSAAVLERAIARTVAWRDKVLVPTVGPQPVPLEAPPRIIVDDGAPF